MNGYKSYTLYLSIKNHFNLEKYQYFKNRGQVKATYESYMKRRDRPFFEGLANTYPTKERMLGFLICNFVYDKNFYIADYKNNFNEKRYQEWVGRVESLVYCFKQDLRIVENESIKSHKTFRDIFRIKKGKITSRFVEMALEGVIGLETYIIVDNLLGLSSYYEGKIQDPLYDEFAFKVKKYSPFIKLDRTKFLEIFEGFV